MPTPGATAAATITGIGAVTPLGNDAERTHERWVAGELGLDGRVGTCAEFDPSEVMARKEARRVDRHAQLALAAADEALRQAGWEGGLPYEPERIACVVATACGGLTSIEADLAAIAERGPSKLSPLAVPRAIGNLAAALITMRYGLHGESAALVAACASSTQAIGAGLRMIRTGEADAVVVGGADAAPGVLTGHGYDAMGATSPSGVVRPFDRRRDGFLPGEGAGILVLEHPELAAARGASAVGELVGYGASSDAYHVAAPSPNGAGAALAMRRALGGPGVAAEDVAYVNAHGPGTPVGDRTETAAIKEVFGEHAYRLAVSSTKSTIGHLQGAAGAVEAICTLLALRDGVAPPTLGLEEPDAELDLDYVPLEARALDGDGRRLAISNSFGLGGHNATVALRV